MIVITNRRCPWTQIGLCFIINCYTLNYISCNRVTSENFKSKLIHSTAEDLVNLVLSPRMQHKTIDQHWHWQIVFPRSSAFCIFSSTVSCDPGKSLSNKKVTHRLKFSTAWHDTIFNLLELILIANTLSPEKMAVDDIFKCISLKDFFLHFVEILLRGFNQWGHHWCR